MNSFPPPQQQEPGPYTAVPMGDPNPKAKQALILGILGILCCGPLSIVAFVFGNQARDIAAQLPGNPGADNAKMGRILGIVGMVLMVLGIILMIILIAAGALTADAELTGY